MGSDLCRLSDSDLLARVRRGDIDALEVLYDRHVEAAWRVALAFSESATAAEQAVLAAFVRLWREPEPAERTSLPALLRSSVWREATGRSAAPITPH